MAGGDDHPAIENRESRTEDVIRDGPAENRHHVNGHRVGAVDERRFGGGIAEPGLRGRQRHEQNEQRPHAIVGKTLPQFGEEQRVERLGMAEELRMKGQGGLGLDRDWVGHRGGGTHVGAGDWVGLCRGEDRNGVARIVPARIYAQGATKPSRHFRRTWAKTNRRGKNAG